MIGEMQIPVRKVIPWQVDASRKAVGLNPGADKGFFTHEISAKVVLNDHLVVEYVFALASEATTFRNSTITKQFLFLYQSQ